MASLAVKAWWNAFTLWHARSEKALPYWPLDRIQNLQSSRVRSIVGHAYQNVPYYRETMDRLHLKPADFQTADDLGQLPLITGTDFAHAPDRFVDRSRTSRALRIDSSGTSGKSKSIYHDHRSLFLCLAHGHRQREVLSRFTGRTFGYSEVALARPAGVQNQMRQFYESHSWTPRGIDFKRTLLPPGGTVEEQVSVINDVRPTLIRGYGSYVGTLFRLARRRGLDLHLPKVVAYGGDSMSAADQDLIENSYGIPVLSTYQTVEALRLGYVCEQRRGFHLFADTIATRVVNGEGADVPPGARGHLVVSNLVNRATVLLNYRLGDIVSLETSPCPCRRTLPAITGIDGRSDDIIALADGSFRHALVILEGLRFVPGVMQVQLVQEELDRFVINAIARPDANRTQAATGLTAALNECTKTAVRAEVRWLDEFPREPGQKLKAVVSHVEAE